MLTAVPKLHSTKPRCRTLEITQVATLQYFSPSTNLSVLERPGAQVGEQKGTLGQGAQLEHLWNKTPFLTASGHPTLFLLSLSLCLPLKDVFYRRPFKSQTQGLFSTLCLEHFHVYWDMYSVHSLTTLT